MEIKSHKAADIVSYIKNLQKRGVSEREFKVRERERGIYTFTCICFDCS